MILPASQIFQRVEFRKITLKEVESVDSEEKERQRQKIADFRYSVVAELCNPYLEDDARRRLIREKTNRQYVIPCSEKTTISAETIRNWRNLYSRSGKEGLLPKPRTDRGRQRSFSDQEAQALIQRLEEKPRLTATAALAQLKNEGVIRSSIKSSSLSRFIKANNLERKNRLKEKDDRDQRRFGFEYPLECVQADAMHGFPVPDGKGKKKKAILLAFIDDATRRIVFAEFAFSERSELFEAGIRHVLKSHGKIGILYTDNGSTFVSHQTRRITESLGIILRHSKPYRPQGRGKIERFFRTVRDSFLRPLEEDEIQSLDQLNHLFKNWLETEYHRQTHSSLGITPIDAWLAGCERVKAMDPFIDLDEAFYHKVKRKVYKDSVVSVNGKAFEVPAILIGKKVDISYDPMGELFRISVSHDGKNYGEARPVDIYGNTKIKRNKDFSGEIEITESESACKGVLL